jgi:spoIIIJ-associated protein
LTEVADRVAALVERVVDALDLDAAVLIEQEGPLVTATVEGEDLGLFIGRHGQTIEAVQHLAQRAGRSAASDGERTRVVVDADGYRARRQEALQRLADEAADEALDGGRSVALDAMSSAERRIVHEHLRDRDDVETHSEGDEPGRHLVVSPRD